MTAPITITMLGGSKTGKTCFLVGMYGIMRRGVRGFTFAAQDLDDDLKLARDYKTLRAAGPDRWPRATDQSKDYELDFCYAFNPIRRFAWHDYRGGALEAASSDSDKAILIDRLLKSSCILLCFSAAHLASPDGFVTEEGEDESSMMNQYMKMVRARAEEEGRPLPAVVIVLTKYDLVAGQPKEEILEKVRDLFHTLYAPGGKWTVTTCPVSLGKTLASDASGGAVEPLNIHLPVSFALYYALQQEIADASEEHEKIRQDFAFNSSRSRLARWWNKVDLDGKKLKVNQTATQLQELRGKLQLLFGELVAGIEIYYDGMEIEADV